AELFSRIDVPEPSAEVALPLLNHYASALAERFNLQIEADAILQSAQLTAHYIWNDQLPGKALKVLYRACEDLDYDRTHAGRAARPVTADDIVRVVAERSGVPEETLRGVGAKLDYEGALAADIIGQPHAVREAATELGLIKAGMTEPGKPASVMMFLGQ